MPKRLVVCSDGTWNRPDGKCVTNVVKMARAVAPRDEDGNPQVVFYDPGVGTGRGFDRFLGGAFGLGLSENVLDNYRFLIHNHEEGDEIFLFGFSRGAFTARSTAGLIRNCGLLKKRYSGQIPEAYKLYRDRSRDPNHEDSVAFRESYSRTVRIRFIGVWDTVGSLGIPKSSLFGRFTRKRSYEFHDTALSSYVDAAFHAVAIDETRGPFQPTLWEGPKAEGQVVEQVWFAGAHSNVGGGYPDAGLSDLAFLWMKDRAHECGLRFDEEYVGAEVHGNLRGLLVNSRKGFYRVLKPHIRQIGRLTNGTEEVHSSARDRIEANLAPPYAPKNLRDFRGPHRVSSSKGERHA